MTVHLGSLQQLQTLFTYVEDFIRLAVTRAQSQDDNPNDALKGLIISDEEIDDYLAKGPFANFWDSSQPLQHFLNQLQLEADSPMARLADTFQLSAIDFCIFLLCLAPEFDRRYERLYAYLQNDVSQRRPTVNLMMNLLGYDTATRFQVWERLMPDMPLRRFHLVQCAPEAGQGKAPFLTFILSADQRIVSYLLGDTTPDERLRGAVMSVDTDPRRVDAQLLEPLTAFLPSSPMIYLQGVKGVGRREMAAALCARFNLPLICIDLAQLIAKDASFDLLSQLTMREAYLAQAALLLYDWDSALDEHTQQPPADFWASLLTYPYPVFICGRIVWEPQELNRARRMLRVNVPLPAYPERHALWTQALTQQGAQKVNPDELARKFRFTPSQIARAVQTAADLAVTRGEGITLHDLYSGAQAHSQLRLGQLAKQIIPRYTWDDVILPPDRMVQLRELCDRAENIHLVRDVWGFGRKSARTASISALFAGESGTGKTLSAEVIASHLGLVLYKIDLSAVVSKYIGETEKNLAVIFEEAQAANAILFFDEADALFGKRSEVKDARDRYANIETAYLLQRIEDYEGIAILATNLRQNMDEAFTRRLDVVVDFPFPDPEYRRRIWEVHFPPQVPLAADVDLTLLAERYNLAGGNIRNAALTSAYIAAADGKVITMKHIQHAVRREHQKMGRLLAEKF
jgi:AAA+ superfamily predicted ATPase